MISRILLYGLAFGSASAAVTYMHFVNGLYAQRTGAAMLSMALSFIVPGIATFLFVKSLYRTQAKNNIGKVLFGSLIVGLIISAATIFCYGTILGAKPQIKEDLLSKSEALMKVNIDGNDKIPAGEKDSKLAEFMKNYEENLKPSNFGLTQLPGTLGICLVVSLITVLFHTRHDPLASST